MSKITLPPMEHNLWGTAEEGKPLSNSVKKLLGLLLGAKPTDAASRIPAAQIKLSEPRLTDGQLHALENIVGADYVSQDHEQRLRRSHGKSYPDLLDWRTDKVIAAPDAVIAPGTEAEVLEVLQYCSRERIAVVTFGGGSSVVGGVNPVRREFAAVISLDVNRFTQLEDVDMVSALATLGAGLTGPAAELLLGEHGLQLGHYPQSFPYATIGGYAAARSSGQSSSGYGRFDSMVRALTVVTPQGIMEIGGPAPASATGPDLRQLFLGSEGTLGVITRVRVRIHPIPEVKRYEAFSFRDFKAGVAAVRAVAQQGTGPTVIRLSDDIESSINLSSTDKIGETNKGDSGCTCITMFEGSPEHAKSRHAETRAVLLAHGAKSLGEEPARQWEQGRFGAPMLRDALLDNHVICETLETATDWSNILKLRAAVVEALGVNLPTSPSIVMCHVSHIYPEGASLYFTIISGQSAAPHEQWWKAKAATCRAIVTHGGTISHHHGVGTDHRPYLESEIGSLGIKLLQAAKDTLDPVGIMNPGKLF
ncbi:FAD-binding oxidoreductase [Mobiluncus mulieris]|uniref:FAD-binding oxidoreductase n=1 Tax=Mobiluncus mulieris TaxID=2052 RepID=UPI001E6477C2|nr:FAD-binding oxidoreductase [Mobiluncus mulieris]